MAASAEDGEDLALGDPAYRGAVVDLLGVIAYGEISAFERLAEDAKLAPTLQDKVALARMASRASSPRSSRCTSGSASSAATRSRRWHRSGSRSTPSTATPRRPTGWRAW